MGRIYGVPCVARPALLLDPGSNGGRYIRPLVASIEAGPDDKPLAGASRVSRWLSHRTALTLLLPGSDLFRSACTSSQLPPGRAASISTADSLPCPAYVRPRPPGAALEGAAVLRRHPARAVHARGLRVRASGVQAQRVTRLLATSAGRLIRHVPILPCHDTNSGRAGKSPEPPGSTCRRTTRASSRSRCAAYRGCIRSRPGA